MHRSFCLYRTHKGELKFPRYFTLETFFLKRHQSALSHLLLSFGLNRNFMYFFFLMPAIWGLSVISKRLISWWRVSMYVLVFSSLRPAQPPSPPHRVENIHLGTSRHWEEDSDSLVQTSRYLSAFQENSRCGCWLVCLVTAFQGTWGPQHWAPAIAPGTPTPCAHSWSRFPTVPHPTDSTSSSGKGSKKIHVPCWLQSDANKDQPILQLWFWISSFGFYQMMAHFPDCISRNARKHSRCRGQKMLWLNRNGKCSCLPPSQMFTVHIKELCNKYVFKFTEPSTSSVLHHHPFCLLPTRTSLLGLLTKISCSSEDVIKMDYHCYVSKFFSKYLIERIRHFSNHEEENKMENL